MKVISIHQQHSQSLANHSTSSKGSRPSTGSRKPAEKSGQRSQSETEDYLGQALWFTRELQREYVGCASISMRD